MTSACATAAYLPNLPTRFPLLGVVTFLSPLSASPRMNRRFFVAKPMESQRRYLLDADVVDRKSSGRFSVDGLGNRGTVRPEMPPQPQHVSINKEQGYVGTPESHGHHHEPTIRRRLQFCGLLISLAFIIYIFIPWGSPYLSWLGADSPIILYAQETLRSLPLIHASDDAIRDDPISMPNVSCKLHGWLIWSPG